MSALVSIVIPVYNGSDYMWEAIDSIIKQTYKNREIIVVNDGSTDEGKTEEIALSFGNSIKYYCKENGGVADALNFGITMASGQYIARMDADDVALPDRIAKQVEYMEKHPEIDVAASSYMLIDRKGKLIKEEFKQFSFEEIKYELLFDNPICHPTVMFRRSIFDEGWSYRNVFAEDYDMWTRLAICKNISVMPDVLLKYRIHADNLSSINVLKMNDSDINSASIYIKILLGIHIHDNRKWLLTRTYHLSQITADEVGGCGEFLMAQIEFLRRMKEKAEQLENRQKNILINVIFQRWRKIINLSNIIDPPEELYEFPSGKIESDSYKNRLKKVIEENDRWIRSRQAEKVKFFLYGFGERGHRTLKRYQQLHRNVLNNWELLGIVDREKKSYSVGEHICQTCNKEKLIRQEYDYILVSAFEYYEEVRHELLELKIPGEKILRDNILFFF